MYDFLRVAAAVPKIEVADVATNTKEIIKKIDEAKTKKADLVVFPELSLTGYTCGDLFFQAALMDEVKDAINKIAKKSGDIRIAVGAPLVINGGLYNTAVVMAEGKIWGIVPKTFIPEHNEFSEKRWFSSSQDLNISKINATYFGLGDYDISVGRNRIFDIDNGIAFGVELCQDMHAPLSPGTFLALNGANVIVNLSASNELITKRDYRRQMIEGISRENMCGYIYASSGEGESTSDLVFSGFSAIAERGNIVCENEKEVDSDYLLIKDIDLGKINADRIKNKTFKDAGAIYGGYEPCTFINLPKKNINGDGEWSDIEKSPFVPTQKSERLIRCKSVFALQVAGLKRRLEITGARPVIGVSGGLDSTLALLVSAKACEELKKEKGYTVGITMPCFGTTKRTENNSIKLMEGLGISAKEINIKDACIKHFADIGQDPESYDLTFENSQARERTQVLMDYAGKIGGFVVGTGDLSELALGWCTYNGDHMSMYGVNAGVPKTLIPAVIESIIEYDLFPLCNEVLKDILNTPISPELLPPDESGKISQRTEELVGPYELHDFFLYYIIRFGFEPRKIYYLAKKAFGNEYDDNEILKWLRNFYNRFFTQQFKRNCMPDGVKVGSVGLSPRGDWKMPSDASAKLWLEKIKKL